MAIPQFHQRAVPHMLGERERGLVVRGLELAEVIDVTAEAVHEVQSIVQHPPPPPMWRLAVYHLSTGCTNPTTPPPRPSLGRPLQRGLMILVTKCFSLAFAKP